jgi:hypothetical protein
MWRTDPLLVKDLETNDTTDVAWQRRGKNASTTELLLETVFSTRSVQRGYNKDNCGDPVSWGLSSACEAVKIEPERVKLKNIHC